MKIVSFLDPTFNIHVTVNNAYMFILKNILNDDKKDTYYYMIIWLSL